MNNYRRNMAPSPERTTTRLGANETPVRTTRFKLYTSLSNSVRAVYALFATQAARIALRSPVPEFVEGAVLDWAMGVLDEGER